MNIDLVKKCPHCSKGLAAALDYWAENFSTRLVDDDFAEEISELLSNQANAIRLASADRFLKGDELCRQ
tara:strand:+ start:2460 stop:2666 length:207 start_codon:yes stop_codon:yes gene_type:complete